MINRYAPIALLLLVPTSGKVALGDIALSIERFNDTEARISGVGTIGVYDNLGGRRIFRLLDDPLVGTAPPLLTLHAIDNNSVAIGGTPLLDTGTLANTSSRPDRFFLRTIGQPADGGAFEGMVGVSLNAQTWAPVGSTGTVIWGNQMNDVGVWSIVSPAVIPEPSAIPLLAVLASVVGCRRRRRPSFLSPRPSVSWLRGCSHDKS